MLGFLSEERDLPEEFEQICFSGQKGVIWSLLRVKGQQAESPYCDNSRSLSRQVSKWRMAFISEKGS